MRCELCRLAWGTSEQVSGMRTGASQHAGSCLSAADASGPGPWHGSSAMRYEAIPCVGQEWSGFGQGAESGERFYLC